MWVGQGGGKKREINIFPLSDADKTDSSLFFFFRGLLVSDPVACSSMDDDGWGDPDIRRRTRKRCPPANSARGHEMGEKRERVCALSYVVVFCPRFWLRAGPKREVKSAKDKSEITDSAIWSSHQSCIGAYGVISILTCFNVIGLPVQDGLCMKSIIDLLNKWKMSLFSNRNFRQLFNTLRNPASDTRYGLSSNLVLLKRAESARNRLW